MVFNRHKPRTKIFFISYEAVNSAGATLTKGEYTIESAEVKSIYDTYCLYNEIRQGIIEHNKKFNDREYTANQILITGIFVIGEKEV